MSDDDRDHIMRIIIARCGDVLSEAELDLIGEPPDADAIPGHIGLQNHGGLGSHERPDGRIRAPVRRQRAGAGEAALTV